MLTRRPELDRRTRFRMWRATRPFWGGVLLSVSGAMLLLPAVATVKVGDLLISISTIAGVSTLLLGSMMLVCAFAVFVRDSAKVPAGVAAMILALVALPAANFGGYVMGSLLGVIGSAATLAWTAVAQPPAEADDAA